MRSHAERGNEWVSSDLNTSMYAIEELMMRKIFHVKTNQREQLVDITSQVQHIVTDSGVQNGLAAVYLALVGT